MNTRGFTLIELLVAIALIVITATIAVPNFQGLAERNQLSAEFNHMLSGINYARSEAVKRRSNITVDVTDPIGASTWKLEVKDSAADTLRVIEGKHASLSVTPFIVSFNALGRRASCDDGDADTTTCSLEMNNGPSVELVIEASGNIARP